MKKKYRLKKKYKIIFSVIILLIIGTISLLYIQYRLSNTYKFKELGYNKNQIEYLTSLNDKFQDRLLDLGYDKEIIKLIKQKYFIEKNFDRYLSYQRKNSDDSLKDIIAKVNVNRDRDFYEKPTKTDISKGNLMLVNKYYYLESSYKPKSVISASSSYAYADILASKESYEAFIDMFNSAKTEGLKLILNSGYRTYDSQKKVYEDFDRNYGEEYADKYAARAGFSEHQTGLSYDIVKPGYSGEQFEKTNEFKWLQENAHKFGFILRYPKAKENLTGFKYESWHYRYVGKEVATKIKKENITFDEYYAYYVENK